MNPKPLLLSIITIKLLVIHAVCQIRSDKAPYGPSLALPETIASHGALLSSDENGLQDEPTSYFREQSLLKTFDKRASFDGYINYAMRALALVAGFDNDLHRYDSSQDLIHSFARNRTTSGRMLSEAKKVGENWRAQLPMSTAERQLLADQSDSTLIENQQNQMECGAQLDKITEEARKLLSSSQEFSSSNQLSLIDYLDSFGAPQAQMMQGNFLWLGSQEQCTKASLSALNWGDEKEEIGTRYCVANFRAPHWPINNQQQRLGGFSIKLGVCLPKSCNSLSYFRHGARIESLAKLARLQQAPFSSYKLVHLFCLPDESSPLRQFSLSARIFILLLSSWLTTLVYFSLKYEYQRMRWLSVADRNNPSVQFHADTDNLMKIFAFRLSWSTLFVPNGSSSSQPPEENTQVLSLNTEGKLWSFNKRTLESGATNLGAEFDEVEQQEVKRKLEFHLDNNDNESCVTGEQNATHKAPNLLTALRGQPKLGPAKGAAPENLLKLSLQQGCHLADGSSVVIVNQGAVVGTKQQVPPSRAPSVDLSVIEGIKVLSMVWLIGGHTLLFFIRTIANGRDFWSVLKDARFMTIMAGIFPVDTFFTITGILTAYLKFNKNNGEAMEKLRYWLQAFVHRYLRFMPMYLIIFWYTRDVSEYIGSGPLWDYATADTSLRSVCKQESFTVPLLFQANFKPIDQHCVKPAWYLANDYQYLLMTPLFMGLIMRSTLLGYSVIGLSILASLVLQFLTVYHTIDLDDFETIINFKPMFGAYVLKNLWKLYVLPYNRIPPYLIGILTGHMMYKLRVIRADESSSGSSNSKQEANRRLNQTKDSQFRDNPLGAHHHQSTATILSASSSSSSTNRFQTARHLLDCMANVNKYLCAKIWIPLVLLVSIIYLPMTTRILTLEGFQAKIGTSSVIALMRFVWSMSIARLIFICATRFLHGAGSTNWSRPDEDSFVIRFLSSPKWKPWSKVGLSALLIQWEIISYLAQIQTSAPNMTISFLLAIVLLSVTATYSLALLIYLTLEYPLSQIEHLYIHPAIFGKS